jgi:Icc-related predicted phosphoesterase
MKIICTSDLHGHLPRIPECDVLCISGDLVPLRYARNPRKQMGWLIDEFNEWCVEQPAKDILIIAGNHDWMFDDKECKRKLSARWSHEEPPYQYLLDRSVIIDHVKFHGSPWMPEFCYWPFEAPDRLAEIYYNLIPEDVDVLLSHCPPQGICDLGGFLDNCGSWPLLDRLEDVKPKLHVFGHIHPSGNQMESKSWEDGSKSIFANVSLVNNKYEPANKLLEYDSDSNEAKWIE